MARLQRRRRWLWVGVLSLGVLAIGAAWLGWRVWTVKGELDQLASLSSEARAAIDAGDPTELSDAAQAMAAVAGRASSAMADPVWRLAEGVPGAGPNFTAVRVVAAELGTRAEALGAASIQLARAPQALAERLGA